MKKLAVGILAHVDAGKTTLSEGLLYGCGQLKKLGRVDHRDAFLDTDALERERGITIFSKQAVLPLETVEITLLDTPGHVDFSSEMERTLGVLDYAILVISGTDGVQGHTQTLWRLLERYHVPTLLFVNKMDLAGADRVALLAQLKARLSDGCADVGADFAEQAALCDEGVLNRYLAQGELSDGDVAALIAARTLFPCYFGSALRLDGVAELLLGLERYTQTPTYGQAFGARVYKIGRDPQGTRLTYLKITGGRLGVKDLIAGDGWAEKADQLRIYSGAKYQPLAEAAAGTVCAVTGLTQTRAGQGLGAEQDAALPVLAPVLAYGVILPQGCDPHLTLQKLCQLEEEDPQLHIVWNEQLREIQMQLMGQVQLEILKRLIFERFALAVDFGPGSIVYRETIAGPVVGVGHYEPLRHYAEVHLLLEPQARGSGLRFAADCAEDVLPRGWQRLVLTHLEERTHLGVLVGAPITDLSITLVAGRGHLKHTEGGDFRQATYRAVRQGLMQAEGVLLEPWYDIRLEVPVENVGRAMADVQRMAGDCPPPQTQGAIAVLTASAPVAAMGDYAIEVTAYTRGQGRLLCAPGGYRPCARQDEVVAALGYDPERDLDHTPDSIFCAHGAGFTVKWDEIAAHMHVDSGLRLDGPEPSDDPAQTHRRAVSYQGTTEQDKELQAIFERTYGPVKQRAFQPPPKPPQPETEKRTVPDYDPGPEYLLVDGYNIIHDWEDLKATAQESLSDARQALMDLLCNYKGYKNCEIILVFDAYKVPGGVGEVSRYHNIHVVYTKEAETADAYIEKATYALGKKHRVRVATSDGIEQLIILGHGALRVSARAFRLELEQTGGEMAALLRRINRKTPSRPLQAALQRAQEETQQHRRARHP